jgi:hypothetical protein
MRMSRRFSYALSVTSLADVFPAGALIGPIVELFRRRAVRSTAPWRRGAHTSREITVHEDLDATAAQCRALLRKFGEERAADQPATGVRVEVVTPKSNMSVGSVVRVDLIPAAAGTRATISSWPGAQLFDFGESKQLVATIADSLAEESRSERSSP